VVTYPNAPILSWRHGDPILALSSHKVLGFLWWERPDVGHIMENATLMQLTERVTESHEKQPQHRM